MERQTRLAIDLGGEQVRLRRLEASEALGEPFTFLVEIVAPLGELDLLPHLGKPVAVSVSLDGESRRAFHGLVAAGEHVGDDQDGFVYRLTLRPWTHFLAQNRNYAIFQDMDALEIIKSVFDASGIAKVDYGQVRRHRTSRPYCVQYGESDFTFVSRLMEEEGFYYHFRHTADAHEMVLCESPQSHAKGTPETLVYNPGSGSLTDAVTRVEGGAADLQSWHERVASEAQARVTLRDWNFKKADAPLEVSTSGPAAHPHDETEVYGWPGGYDDPSVGQPLSDTRLDALRAQRALFFGESQEVGLSCGALVDVSGHGNARFNTRYLLSRTHHVVSPENYRSASAEGDTHVSFEAIRADTIFQSPLHTPRPVVSGPETAIVTGPAGEEIYTDDYGRVKVRFHWDRADTPGERATCWIRVSQTGGLGNIILPRVGHEVIVDFLHGDPDRPIVTGRVFNSLHKPIYALPDNKTRALWRTKTYGTSGSYAGAMPLDTGAPGVNELRFEDQGGKEEVFLHAERDLNTRVRYTESHHVGLHQDHKVGGNRTEAVTGGESVSIGMARTVSVGQDDSLEVTGALKIKAGTTIDIEAGTKITLKVGDSTIGIDLMNIEVQAAMQALFKAAMQVDVKGAMTSVNGDAMLTLKGGITMINT